MDATWGKSLSSEFDLFEKQSKSKAEQKYLVIFFFKTKFKRLLYVKGTYSRGPLGQIRTTTNSPGILRIVQH